MVRLRTEFLLLVLLLSLYGCSNEITLESQDRVFRFAELNEVVYSLDDEAKEVSYLVGHNIASGDYEIGEGTITFKKSYLVTLAPGEYAFTVHTTTGMRTIELSVEDQHQSAQIINGGFETGDLFGWTAITHFKGENALQSFINSGVIRNETMFDLTIPYGGDGEYVYGLQDVDGDLSLWEEKMGILRSSSFTLSGSGFITFKLGGGRNSDLTYLSVRKTETDEEVARYGNSAYHAVDFLTSPNQYFVGNLVLYQTDLSDHLGESLYLELVDLGSRTEDYLTFDSFNTYWETSPALGIPAMDIKPVFAQNYVPNQVMNGNFDQDFTGWTVAGATGWQNSALLATTWQIEDGVMKSNADGDAVRGLLRSSLFRVDGSGIISLEIGAAMGTRFDKDTFISIKEAGTNREIFRFANTSPNGIFLVKYYLDLSAYKDKNCYFEIIDNGRNGYDTIFIDQIDTYYETAPVYDYSQAAINLID